MAQGVRPFKLHCTRHTYASLALAAGKSVRWVAEQLGHANPELTLRTYAHVLQHEETDLSFADFAQGDIPSARESATRLNAPQAHPRPAGETTNENAPAATQRGRIGFMERETGVEPATLSLGS